MRCPKLAETTSAESRRMAAAAQYGRFRASLEVSATCASNLGPDRRRESTGRRKERPGGPLGGQNSPFGPQSAPIRALTTL